MSEEPVLGHAIGEEVQARSRLLEGAPEHAGEEEQDGDRAHAHPVLARQPSAFLRLLRGGALARTIGVSSEIATPGSELRDAEEHAEAGHGEPEVPAEPRIDSVALEEPEKHGALREEAAHERRRHRPDVDPHVEDGEAGVTADIVLAVQAADHRADVRLEEADADDDEREPEIEERSARHRERKMSRGDDAAADEHGAALPQEAVGDPPAGSAER